MALRGFRPGCQQGASAQGCLRTLRTTECFNHYTVGGWERICEGNIQLPAADSRAASTVTFCLRDLPASIAEKVKSSAQLSDEEGEKQKALTAISISSALSLAWIAVNPPSSPNWKIGTSQTKYVKMERGWHQCVITERLLFTYPIHQVNQPAVGLLQDMIM